MKATAAQAGKVLKVLMEACGFGRSPRLSASTPGTERAGEGDRPSDGPRIHLTAWGLSLLCHGVLLVFVGLSLREAPPKGTTREYSTVVGIAIRPAPPPDVSMEPQGLTADGSEEEARTSHEALAISGLGDLIGQPSESPLARVLPEATLGAGRAQTGEVTPFSPGPPGGSPDLRGEPGGKARVRLFGIVGEGYKFVYVFDRSDSMNWFEQRPLRAAKAELLASLEGLGETHQFQIIFYNHEPLVFNPAGHPHRLAFGTEENKRRAQRFVESVVASGGTRHMEALLLALNMRPDVIFFLTDADDPQLTDAQVDTIVRRAGGITIHTIEFGYGPPRRSDNFLTRIARLTGGQHVYVDVSRL